MARCPAQVVDIQRLATIFHLVEFFSCVNRKSRLLCIHENDWYNANLGIRSKDLHGSSRKRKRLCRGQTSRKRRTCISCKDCWSTQQGQKRGGKAKWIIALIVGKMTGFTLGQLAVAGTKFLLVFQANGIYMFGIQKKKRITTIASTMISL